MTDSLVQRLHAAIDETERIAQAAGGTWTLEGDRDELLLDFGGKHTTSDIGFYEDDTLRPAEARHIVRHDPAAVLRRCAADRKILAEHRPWNDDPPQACEGCGLDSSEYERTPDINQCPTLLALAEGYGIQA